MVEKVRADVAMLEKTIGQVQKSAQVVASFAGQIYQNKQYRAALPDLEASYLAYLRNLPTDYEQIGIWFEPYIFDDKQKDFALLAKKNKFAEFANCDIYTETNPYDYHKENWYRQFIPEDSTPPATMLTNSIVMPNTTINTIFASPIEDDQGRILGLATIHTDPASLLYKLVTTNNFGQAKIILADRVQNTALYFDATENVYGQKAFSIMPWSNLLSDSIVPTSVNIGQGLMQEQPYYIFTATTSNNLLYAYLVPQDELFAVMHSSTLAMFIIFGLLTAAALFLTTNLVHKTISKPISNINLATEQEQGNFIQELVNTRNTCAEISDLIDNFNNLIRKNNQTLKNLFNNIAHMLCIIDTKDYTIISKNKHLQKMFPNLKEGDKCYKALFNQDRQCALCPVADMPTQANSQADIFNKSNNCLLRINTSFIEWNGKKDHAIISILDITKDHKEKAQLELLAETDELTGTLNRRGGLLSLENLVENQAGENITLAIIDINGLKHVNDAYGHLEGDFYIKATVLAIKQNIRTNDLLSRMGGDEFMIILPNCREENILGMFMRINKDLQSILEREEKPYKGSFAFGTHSFTADKVINIMDHFHLADQKMYENKYSYYNNGRQLT